MDLLNPLEHVVVFHQAESSSRRNMILQAITRSVETSTQLSLPVFINIIL
jgi:hypothetical protein